MSAELIAQFNTLRREGRLNKDLPLWLYALGRMFGAQSPDDWVKDDLVMTSGWSFRYQNRFIQAHSRNKNIFKQSVSVIVFSVTPEKAIDLVSQWTEHRKLFDLDPCGRAIEIPVFRVLAQCHRRLSIDLDTISSQNADRLNGHLATFTILHRPKLKIEESKDEASSGSTSSGDFHPPPFNTLGERSRRRP